MAARYIEETNHDGVVVVELRPGEGAVTTLREEMLSQFAGSIDRIANDRQVRVVIITGVGKMFLVGADLRQLRDRTPGENAQYNQRLIDLFNRVETMPHPSIAAINGPALGGGLELALACTFRYADSSAVLGLPEINLGLIPGAGGTPRLPRLIPRAAAWKLLLTGDAINAGEALSLGLVDALCADGTVRDQAMEFAHKLSKKPLLALRALKDALVTGQNLDLASAIDYTAEKLVQISQSHDMHEGIDAFLSKRHPMFRDE
ncbi:MAG: enoyl-CoA hydratase/isomerase family protein [Sulfobacillus sp.]